MYKFIIIAAVSLMANIANADVFDYQACLKGCGTPSLTPGSSIYYACSNRCYLSEKLAQEKKDKKLTEEAQQADAEPDGVNGAN